MQYHVDICELACQHVGHVGCRDTGGRAVGGDEDCQRVWGAKREGWIDDYRAYESRGKWEIIGDRRERGWYTKDTELEFGD